MKTRLISAFILIAYSAFLMKIMVFKDVPLIRIGPLMINFGGSQTGPANLLPFKTILIYLLGEKGLLIGGINLIGNIILLIPVGLLAPMVYKDATWKKMLVLAAVFGFAIEGLQVVLRIGIFDIDDVILNGLGVMVGYWLFTILAKKVRSMESKNVRIAVATVMIVIVAATFSVFAVYQKDQFPVRFEPAIVHGQPEDIGKREGGNGQNTDPCGGTGGTGRIVSKGNYTITIKGRDSLNQVIRLSDQTTIRNSSRAVLASDLQIGNKVTVVVMESNDDGSKNATAVLVCNEPNATTQSGR